VRSQTSSRQVYARGQMEVPMVNGKPTVIEIPSSNGKKTYKLDLTLGRCSCPGWTMHCKDGQRHTCKHLRQYGYTDV
jgi:hypothetical protein